MEKFQQNQKDKEKKNKEKFHQKNGSGLPNETSRPQPEETSDLGKNTATKRKTDDTVEQKKQFKNYLSKKKGFEDIHPYLWDDLKHFGTELLAESTDVKMSEKLLKKIKDLEPKIAALKTK